MRRIALWLAATVVSLVLLFSYRTSTSSRFVLDTGTAAEAPRTPTTTTANRIGVPGAPPVAGPRSELFEAGTAPVAGDGTQTITGPAADTDWGPVQVEVTLSGGAISHVVVVEYPHENQRDIFINETALPILLTQTLDLQSAAVDMVGGATITSEGYQRSLQGALDQAGR